MFSWRITKYNPKNRDLNGYYLLNEWTSYSDINKMFDGKMLTYTEYLAIENNYINAINLFMLCNNLTSLSVTKVEKYLELRNDPHLDATMIALFENIKKGLELNEDGVKTAARLVLREELWCLLESPELIVRFGRDYYMYIGSTKKCADSIAKIQQSGLFVEECDPEYLT